MKREGFGVAICPYFDVFWTHSRDMSLLWTYHAAIRPSGNIEEIGYGG